ncbi:MAG: NADH-quinone oxidoreductase subunit N [Oligoflexia bacterium]|nr:NADH-quinone oxidoreductase subunit N [Oligoflexia bacterium]
MTALFLTACIPITLKVLNKNIEPSNRLTLSIATVGIIVVAVLTKLQGLNPSPLFFGALIFDKMAQEINHTVLAITLFTLFLSYSNVNTKEHTLAEHVFLVLSSATGMMTLASSTDLMVTFVGLELMSIALYVLIALGHEQRFSKEAAFKYFILGSFASAIFLFGVSFIFGVSGTTQMHVIANSAQSLLTNNNLFIIGVGMIIIGIGFKVSLFPFHAWTPDVYQGAPTPVSAFMATGVKLVMFAAFIRLAMDNFFNGSTKLNLIMQILAVLTMFAGNISALVQENVKRIVAYSSVAHAGYMFIGIIAASQASSLDAATATLFYVIIYAVMNMGAFAVISIFERQNRDGLNINNYAGIGFKKPFLGAALSIFMLSLAGMPPMVGFIGKFYVFSSAIQEGYLWLTIFGVLNSLVSAYYYLRVVVIMYMKEPSDEEIKTPGAWPAKAVVAITAVLTIIFGIMSQAIYRPSEKSVTKISQK